MTVNQRFGDLLTEGIISIAKRQRKTVAAVEREITQALGWLCSRFCVSFLTWMRKPVFSFRPETHQFN